MNVGSLFSGIGGLDYGLHRAGLRHVFFCEQDPWRRDVLAARWPGVPIYDDVRDVARSASDVRLADGWRERQVVGREGTFVDSRQAGTDAGAVGLQDAGGLDSPDLLCGGFPCQDLSVAGQRRGLAGERSGLFHEFARIAESLRPRWVLVENVPGLLSSNGGRDFGVVVGTLADLGYGVAWRVLDSRFFGVPQRRRRVFIVGAVADGDPAAAADRAGQVLAVGSRCPGHPATRGEARPDFAVASLSGLGTGGPDDNDGQANRVIVADTLREHPRPGSNSNGAMVAHSLTSEGHDASEDGSGRGTPMVAAPLMKGSASGDGVNPPGRRQEDDVNIVATAFHMTQEPIHGEEFTPAIGRTSIGMGVSDSVGVRRLTPVEAERLQALPDGWTRLDSSTPDSRRYSALGDAVTASVAEWIGGRLLLVHEREPETAA